MIMLVVFNRALNENTVRSSIEADGMNFNGLSKD